MTVPELPIECPNGAPKKSCGKGKSNEVDTKVVTCEACTVSSEVDANHKAVKDPRV